MSRSLLVTYSVAFRFLFWRRRRDWKRPPGRTWLRTIEQDLRPLNIGLVSAWQRAQDRERWKRTVETATLQDGAFSWRWSSMSAAAHTTAAPNSLPCAALRMILACCKYTFYTPFLHRLATPTWVLLAYLNFPLLQAHLSLSVLLFDLRTVCKEVEWVSE